MNNELDDIRSIGINKADEMKKLKLISYFFIFLAQSLLCNAQAVQKLEIPKGRVETFQFNKSKIYPGTERTVTVYLPAQLDPSKPACVYVQQDGIRPNSASVMDSLIAINGIPVMVGVFVNPGNVPPADSNTKHRPNRCFEYDALGDAYARFILEEILPFVVEKYKLNLSDKGDDRGIGGASSGGISAFNAAWERPDAFTRVYCNSGSFVGFRGGHEFPLLVRKTEAKPIRAYLTTGTNDMENCAGNWFLVDQEMDKALKFSGYDYQFRILEGKHVVGYKEYFAEAMTYLWKDWPEPVKTGLSAPRVQDIILKGETWKLVADGFVDARGPACNAKGEVFFVDEPANKIFKISTSGNVATFLSDGGHSSGLSFGAKGELYSVSSKTGKIKSYNSQGKETLYAEEIYGEYVLAKPDGGIYVSEAESGKVWMVKEGNKIMVDSGIKFPTGIAMSPDHWLLAVAENQSHWVYSYTIAPDGKLNNKERFFWLHVPDAEDNSKAESVCYDREGHLYVATNYGIQVCAWDGPTQVILPLPNNQAATGVCIGGAEFDTLFVFCGDKIYKRKIKNHTVGTFTPWTQMSPGKL
ncbi:MAG: alpha/beta hydrolase-fold protein [Prolixibacteraceae bacterium]|jgi:sugar lactone lactonase YvrE/enterochelin esterase-like enzyme|nr:alpha/beta hydrolase-fold protein [Prolixibacteraceae bacterium]